MCKFTVVNNSVNALLDRGHVVAGLLSSLRAGFLEDVVFLLGGSDRSLTAGVSADDGADFLDAVAAALLGLATLLLFLAVLLAELRADGLGEELEES